MLHVCSEPVVGGPVERCWPCRALRQRRFTSECPTAGETAAQNSAVTVYTPQLPQTQLAQSGSDAGGRAALASVPATAPALENLHDHDFVYLSFDHAPLHVGPLVGDDAASSARSIAAKSPTSPSQTPRAKHYAKWAWSWAKQLQTGTDTTQTRELGVKLDSTPISANAAEQASVATEQAARSVSARSPARFVPSCMSMELSFQQKIGLGQWACVPLRQLVVEDYMFSLRTLLCYAPKRMTNWMLSQISVRESTFAVLVCFQRLLAQRKGDNQCSEAAKAVLWLRTTTALLEFTGNKQFKARHRRLERGFRRMQLVRGPNDARKEAVQLAAATEQLMMSGIRVTALDVSSMHSVDDLLHERQKWTVNRIVSGAVPDSLSAEASEAFAGEELASSAGKHDANSAVGASIGAEDGESGGPREAGEGGLGDTTTVSSRSVAAPGEGKSVGQQWALERVADRVPRISEV